jgi:alpha-tubulin suppressor-like RCC1 family protein
MDSKAFLLPVVALLATSACGDVLGPGEQFPHLWISQTGVILQVGEEAQLGARLLRGARAGVEDVRSARWWTSDQGVVQVDESGRVTAARPGRATVWVESAGARDSGTVVVLGSAAEHRTRWQSVEVGETATCALDTAGRAYCWGWNYWGELGNGTRRQWTMTHAPLRVAGGHTWAEVDVGRDFACGRTPSGEAYCWGTALVAGSRAGQEDHVLLPRRIPFSGAFVQLRTGDGHVCGLVSDGRAFCWGINAHGEVGDGTAGISNHRYQPTAVATQIRFQEIVPGHFRTCALALDGRAHCWGMGDNGRLGTGQHEGIVPLPKPVAGNHEFLALEGSNHTCGTTSRNETYCWGPNTWRQIGVDGTYALGPRRLGSELPFQSLFVGAVTTCGALPDGTTYCQGWNRDGNLGTNEPVTEVCGGVDRIPCSSRPLAVAGGLGFRHLSASMSATCGVTVDDALYCWGSNRFGQLGNGSLLSHSPVPVRVADPL